MSDYTPSTEDVRSAYVDTFSEADGTEAVTAEFDRWLAEHDRQVRAEAIRAFVGRQSVVYRKHSGDAVTEDMVLAIREFGLQAYDFYDDKEGQGWLSGRVAAAILADLDGTQVESEPATAQPPGAPTR